MKLEPGDIADLEPIISMIVTKVMNRREATEAKVNGRLAYTQQEAAGLLGVRPNALRDARRRGEEVGTKVGRRILYDVDSLRRMLSQNRLS